MYHDTHVLLRCTCTTAHKWKSDDPLLPSMWDPKSKLSLLGVAGNVSAYWAIFLTSKDWKSWFEPKIP